MSNKYPQKSIPIKQLSTGNKRPAYFKAQTDTLEVIMDNKRDSKSPSNVKPNIAISGQAITQVTIDHVLEKQNGNPNNKPSHSPMKYSAFTKNLNEKPKVDQMQTSSSVKKLEKEKRLQEAYLVDGNAQVKDSAIKISVIKPHIEKNPIRRFEKRPTVCFPVKQAPVKSGELNIKPVHNDITFESSQSNGESTKNTEENQKVVKRSIQRTLTGRHEKADRSPITQSVITGSMGTSTRNAPSKKLEDLYSLPKPGTDMRQSYLIPQKKQESQFSLQRSQISKQTVDKNAILFLMDHDLDFMVKSLPRVIPWGFASDKLDQYENLTKETIKGYKKITSAQWIFVFIKFSPRVKEKSLKILKELIKLQKTYIIKCIPENESVDIFLDYDDESITVEQKKQIEHTIYLSKETFDTYDISENMIKELKTFVAKKVAP